MVIQHYDDALHKLAGGYKSIEESKRQLLEWRRYLPLYSTFLCDCTEGRHVLRGLNLGPFVRFSTIATSIQGSLADSQDK